MRAFRLSTVADGNGELHIKLPAGTTGPVEVILLLPEAEPASADLSVPQPATTPLEQFDAFLRHLDSQPRFVRSQADIDRYLQEERDSWGEP